MAKNVGGRPKNPPTPEKMLKEVLPFRDIFTDTEYETYQNLVNVYKESLRDRIDRLGLYPITVSTLLTKREKQFLLSRNIVLCRQLLGDVFYLDHLGISEVRKEKILLEIEALCTT